ncbi:MAG: nucleotide exchange factor GrpE [Tropicimonas sp.]|uniref:nucleotide exchange factor GrpE n=1 Tax=Tropicimonas sp. TaxID=2067044 RepID=UPI003A86FDCD
MADAKKDANLDEQVLEQVDEKLTDISLEGLAEDAGEFIGTPQPDHAEELESALAERDEYRDRFMRALADAENARKRSERDRREAEQYGGSKLSRDMLPVYDNLKRALEAVTDEQREASSALIEGIELTMRELLNVFSKHGITLVKPEIGEKFDPQLHQAMFEAPLPETSAGDIIQVMTEGFLMHERLLRPAQVGVSSTPAG